MTLRPVEVGAHFASLRWPAAAGFDAYRVVYRAVRSGATRTVLTVHRSRVRLQGLRADQAYVVHVRGVRRHGSDEGPELTPLASSRLETANATDPAEPGRAWLSGATLSGNVDAATFGEWRGSEMTITGTWNDNYESQVAQWSLRPGYYAGGWTQDLDNAVGAIYKDRGESWHEAAEGAYDDRWASALQNMASLWSGRPGTMYIRFAHEFNGDWYPWSVTRDEIPDFKLAFARFKALKDRYFPDSKLVFCPTSNTAPSFGADWREAFPGTATPT